MHINILYTLTPGESKVRTATLSTTLYFKCFAFTELLIVLTDLYNTESKNYV